MIVRHIAWLSFALALIGCNWTEREGWDGSGIWSDDGRSALGVYQFYEGQDTPTHVRKRNMESAVYFFPSIEDPAESRIISPRRAGWAGPLYLSGRQGYAIIHRKEKLPDLDDGANQTANFSATKIDLMSGQVTPLGNIQYLSMISCDPEGQSSVTTGDVLTVIPNPAGTILAKLEMRSTCDGRTGQLTFLDANSLAVLGEVINLAPVEDVNSLVESAWSENGRFMVTTPSPNGPQGTSYAPNEQAQPLGDIDYSCFYPRTLSGTVNETGQTLDIVDGEVTVVDGLPPFEVFGCNQ